MDVKQDIDTTLRKYANLNSECHSEMTSVLNYIESILSDYVDLKDNVSDLESSCKDLSTELDGNNKLLEERDTEIVDLKMTVVNLGLELKSKIEEAEFLRDAVADLNQRDLSEIAKVIDANKIMQPVQ